MTRQALTQNMMMKMDIGMRYSGTDAGQMTSTTVSHAKSVRIIPATNA